VPAGAVDLLVVGDLMVDVVVRHESPVAVASDTSALVRFHGGGSAANTAAWAGALGLRTRLLAAVGDDPAGDTARRDLEALGVELVGPVIVGGATGTCVVLVGSDGERTMFPDRGANAGLGPEHVVPAVDAGPRALHLSGYTLLATDSRRAALDALASAARRRIPASIDAASAAPLRAVGARTFLSWIRGVDLVFANDDEVASLGGERQILDAASALVVKHGAGGASWTDGDRRVSVKAREVEVVDTTGAGDAFAAGYLVAASRGAGVTDCLDAAARIAARAVSRAGARPSAPVEAPFGPTR
jgi:sugar/nucleoside kinase (ribokinase family)